jgi:hypothetical protein
MRTFNGKLPGLACGALSLLCMLCLVSPAGATGLTFDVYTDNTQPNPTRAANNIVVPQTYGDNVNNFTLAGPVSGNYYSYGSAGDFTPNVEVNYRGWFDTVTGRTTPNPNGRIWNTGYGNLSYVLYPILNGQLLEIRLIPANGYRVYLDEFKVAAFGSPIPNQTISVVLNAGLASWQTVWSSGNVSITGGTSHDMYDLSSLNLYASTGQTLSLMFPGNGNIGVDDIVFHEFIPEPTSAVLMALGGMALMSRRRRRSAM